MSLIVGAYPAAPVTDPWSADVEGEFLDTIAEHAAVSGWEIPFTGSLHAHDEAWMLGRLRAGKRHVLTTVPIAAVRARRDPRYGLASADEAGRAEAMRDMAAARDAVARVADATGHAAIRAVEVHSAPDNLPGHPGGSAAALTRSLQEMSEWDLCGAEILVEHCDAVSADHLPAKGFLSIEDEIAAVLAARRTGDARVGIVVNWARSAIEGRSVDTPMEHIALAGAAGTLRGLMFSGVAGAEVNGMPAWADAHLPPQEVEPASILRAQHIAAAAAAARRWPDFGFVGLKVGAAGAARSAPERAGSVLDSIEVVVAATGLAGSGAR